LVYLLKLRQRSIHDARDRGRRDPEDFRNLAVTQSFGAQMEGLPNLLRKRTEGSHQSLTSVPVHDTFFRIWLGIDRALMLQRSESEQVLRLPFFRTMATKCQVASDAKNPRPQMRLWLFLLQVVKEAEKDLLNNFLAFGRQETERQQISKEGNAQLVKELNDAVFGTRRGWFLSSGGGL
jgi:hypothetical protein